MLDVHQRAVVDWPLVLCEESDDDESGSQRQGNRRTLVVKAHAGSGKTTVGCRMLLQHERVIKYLPNATAQYLAFNTSIVAEMTERRRVGLLPRRVNVNTFHAYAKRVLFPSSHAVDTAKLERLVQARVPKVMPGAKGKGKGKSKGKGAAETAAAAAAAAADCPYDFYSVRDLCTEWRLCRPGERTPSVADLEDLVVERNMSRPTIRVTTEERDAVAQVLADDIAEAHRDVYDFSDCLWLPSVDEHFAARLRANAPGFLFIDEAQDLDRVMIAFVTTLCTNKNTMLVVVGDPRQCINMWKGAQPMATLAATLGRERGGPCDELTLRYTYRLPRTGVNFVNRAFPSEEPMLARPGAPYGMLVELDGAPADHNFVTNDVVLARRNIDLLMLGYALLRRRGADRVRVMIKGRDMFATVREELAKLTGLTVGDARASFAERRLKEARAVYARNRHSGDKTNVSQSLANIVDRYAALECIISQSNVDETDLMCTLVQRVHEQAEEQQRAGAEGAPVVSLTTIHAFKGCETDRVFLLNPDVLRVPRSVPPEHWLAEEIRNLRYTAYTRHRHAMFVFLRTPTRGADFDEQVEALRVQASSWYAASKKRKTKTTSRASSSVVAAAAATRGKKKQRLLD